MNARTPTDFTSLFMLPFVFGPKADPDSGICDLVRLKKAKDAIAAALQARVNADSPAVCRWRPIETKKDEGTWNRFAEREYLHPFARSLLCEQTFLVLDEVPWDPQKTTDKDPRWPMSVTLKGGREVQGLCLVQAYLHLFDIGVGLLAIEVEAQDKENLPPFEDLLVFNEGFRRTGFSYPGEALPQELTISDHPLYLFNQPDSDPSEVPRQGPGYELTQNRLLAILIGRRLQPESPGDGEPDLDVEIRPILDRRMVVLTWAAIPPDREGHGDSDHLCMDDPALDPFWRDLLDVNDGSAYGRSSDGPPAFEAELERAHFYTRWWKQHRIGFTRYSAAFLGRQEHGFYTDVIREHVRGVYYTLALLLFLQRAKLVEMAELSARVAHDLSEGGRTTEARLTDQLRKLRAMYLLFSSRYYFIELTHQDQGVEMGQQWSNIMENPRLFHDLGEEIERFEAFESQRASEAASRWINILMIVLTMAAIWTGLLGANWPWDLANEPGRFWPIFFGSLLGLGALALGVILGPDLVRRMRDKDPKAP